jgi:alpha-L-rhamnosidase
MNTINFLTTTIIIPFILIVLAGTAQAGLIPTHLTCEYMSNPPVVDVAHPRLAWLNIAEPGERGQAQTAWQIRVASSESRLSKPDLWDSGKVPSTQSNRVEYNGKILPSRQECWWQVRVWDRNDIVSEWSEPAFWRMGLLNADDWQAQWIGAPWQREAALPKPPGSPDGYPTELPPPAPLLRKIFLVDKEVARAVAFVTGLGYFEVYINGKKVSEDVLVPNQTNYGKRPNLINENIPLEDNFQEYKVMYLAYDIKYQLNKGDNVIGAILGNGFYNAPKYWAGSYGSPRFLCQVHITYRDGTEEILVSDQSWQASKSAIMMDLVYHGEFYDARNKQPGWCTSGFDASDWEAVAIRKAPEGKLVAHTAPPDRITEQIAPIKIEKIGADSFRVDFGVEISGWLRFKNVQAPPGHMVEIKYLSNQYSGDNTYIFKGGETESYAARFNWFVFSAVELINWPGEPRKEQLTAEAVNTFIEESAVFETSNQLFNEINKIWKRSQTDNMHGGIASDCPHRERAPYTGDGQVACVTVMHNFDARAFYHKWIQDIIGAQNVETGYVPNGAPWQPGCGGGVAWGAAICIMPWEFYLHYGALDILEASYEAMKGYISYMQTWVDEEGIMFSRAVGRDGKPLRWLNLGEWAAPGETVPDAMVHTFYFWRCADLAAQTASVLYKTDEAKHYTELAERTRQAFHKRFYNEERGHYGDGGGNVFALRMGVPAYQYEQVTAALKADMQANDGHLDTGIFGTQFLFEVLSENGMHDLAYQAMNKRTEPSYGRWLELGATTTREHWSERGSHNHPMFGGGLVWFYRQLAGMQADPRQPGYRHIIFKPRPAAEMDYVDYHNMTPYGQAGISWRNDADGRFIMDISVPVGCQATVYVPAKNREQVLESGKKPDKKSGVEYVKMDAGYAVFSVTSGTYRFESVFNPLKH